MFWKSNKVLDIFEKLSWLYGCRSIQSKKEIHSNRKFGSHCFCKIKKPNKNFLKLKCDWWCSYFDMTDGYLRVGMFGGSMSLDCFGGFGAIFFDGFLDQITNYDQKKRYNHLTDGWNKSQVTNRLSCQNTNTPITTGKNYDRKKGTILVCCVKIRTPPITL